MIALKVMMEITIRMIYQKVVFEYNNKDLVDMINANKKNIPINKTGNDGENVDTSEE